MDAVSAAYEKYLKQPLQHDVPIRSGLDERVILPGLMVIQVQDSDWVCVMHGYYDGSEVPVLSGFRHCVLEFAGTDDGWVSDCNMCVPFQKPIRYRIRYRIRTDASVVDEFHDASGHQVPSSERQRNIVRSYADVFSEYGIRPVLIGRDTTGAIVTSDTERRRIVCVNAATVTTG